MVVLNLLAEGPRHGYEMVQTLKQSEGLRIHEGNIYPILARLKIDGLVTDYTETSFDGPPRKYFKLTKQGRKTLVVMNEHWDCMIKTIRDFRKASR